jgi:hypothetical protein
LHKDILFFSETSVVVTSNGNSYDVSQSHIHSGVGFIWLLGAKLKGVALKQELDYEIYYAITNKFTFDWARVP